MTDPTPEPTDLETVAQLAAEAATAALAEQLAALAARVEILEAPAPVPAPAPDPELLARVEGIEQALTVAAGPQGGAAKLAAQLADLEARVAQLAEAPPRTAPELQQLLDDLRRRIATIERKR